MLVTLNKIDEVHFRLLDTNGYHVKAKNKRFTAASSLCRQNLKINMKDCIEKIALESVPHLQQNYFSSFNQQIIDLWLCGLQLPDKSPACATTTSQNNHLIAWIRKNNRAARAART